MNGFNGKLKLVLLAAAASVAAFAAEPLTIEEAVRIAKANAYEVLAAQADSRRARAVVSEAKGSLLPTVTVDGQYTRFAAESTVVINSKEPPIVIRPIDQKSVALNLSQRVDIFGVAGLAISGARALFLASEAIVASAVNDAALRAKSGFLDVLRAEELVGVADERIANVQEELRVARLKNQEGAAAKFDVIRFEAELATAEQERLQAANTLDLAKAAFNEVLARDISTPVELVKPGPVPAVARPLADLTELALQQRPDIVAAARRLDYQNRYRRARQKDGLPALNLSGGITYNPDAGGLGGMQSDASATAVLSFPLFDGGTRRARVSQARADEDRARILLAQQSRAVEKEVKQAYLNVESARQQIETAEKGLELARETLRIARIRYEAGVGTPLELSDANVVLVRARTALVDSTYGYRDAIANLQRAVGIEEIFV
ncbi:MAG: TolC family protein [Armatimonadetes bacterium]|nr:TolC family protein [Armatimonadota bacterium]